MNTVAILPIKRFDAAKQRLGEVSAGTRRALAEAMVTDVLQALRRTQGVDQVLVVTSEPVAEAIGRGYGASVLHDDRETGQSAAATIGIRAAMATGADRVLLVPGDAPALDPGELDAFLVPVPGDGVVIVPDRHGTGTNALLLSPPDVIEPAFGPGSCDRHERLATEAQAACRIVELPSLVLDIDTVEDLGALRETLATSRGGAAHTRGLLSRLSDLQADGMA